MGRLLATLLILLWSSSAFAALPTVNSVATPAKVNMTAGDAVNTIAGGAEAYTDIIFWADFPADSLTLETNNCNSGAVTTWTVGSAADINATAKLSGDYGVDISGAEDTLSLTVSSEDYIKNARGAIVFMLNLFNCPTPPCNEAMLWILPLTYITVASTDELRFSYNGEDTVTTANANIVADTRKPAAAPSKAS